MAIKDLHFKLEYSSDVDNIAISFIQPCLSNSIQYDRLSGYFSSSIYLLVYPSLKEFITRGGLIRLLCSPELSSVDIEAINEGYDSRQHNDWIETLNQEIERMFRNQYLRNPTKLLACLVGLKYIDIKIVNKVSSQNPAVQRLFHEKVGIFVDEEGTSVVFRGSMNETLRGLSFKGNIESISVYTDVDDNNDMKRVKDAREHFENLWDNRVDGIEVSAFPESSLDLLSKESEEEEWEILLSQILEEQTSRWAFSKPNLEISPRDHQLQALDNWVENGRKGIFEHATGSGKTITALLAIDDSLRRDEIPLVIVPSVELLSQWKEEIKKYLPEDINVFVCGDNNTLWMANNGLNVWSRPIVGSKNLIISTIDTASSDLFLQKVNQGEHLFLVVDEVHRIGSKIRSKIMQLSTGPKLGLSATPKRYGDQEGTVKILEFFAGIIKPSFTLFDAIKQGILARYFYHPISIKLSNTEQEQWDEITKQIKRQSAIDSASEGSKRNISDKLMKLFITRARIVKKASAKVQMALDVIREHYKSGQRWLVYCEDQDQLGQVTSLLSENNFDSVEYHSAMVGDRSNTLSYFKIVGGIVVSIRCLDEGVNIPDATHALILASSSNPREFVQRRGRILRLSKDKNFAVLFDAVVVPNNFEKGDAGDVLIHELSRCVQFGKWASNPKCITDLKLLCIKHGIDFELLSNGGFEDE